VQKTNEVRREKNLLSERLLTQNGRDLKKGNGRNLPPTNRETKALPEISNIKGFD